MTKLPLKILILIAAVSMFTVTFGFHNSVQASDDDRLRDVPSTTVQANLSPSTHPQGIGETAGLTHPHNTLLSGASMSQLSPSTPAATYDEQLGTTFTRNFTSVEYDVIAINQTDANGYGPAYLLNGLSSFGYWYQVGVQYNWPHPSGGYQPGFAMIYEVFDRSGPSIFPPGGAGNQSLTVKPGDLVRLTLNFSASNVVMQATDWNTTSTATETFSAMGATYFVGLPKAVADQHGFFTGLMTEWYHVNPYYGNEREVTYSNHNTPLSSAWMWMAEGVPMKQTLFAYETPWPVAYNSSLNQLQRFEANGAFEASDAYVFVTGQRVGQHSTTISLHCDDAVVNQDSPCTATVNDLNSASPTTPTGTVFFTQAQEPYFVSSSNSCTLAPTRTVRNDTCTASFPSTTVGTVDIFAAYVSSDTTHSDNSTTTFSIIQVTRREVSVTVTCTNPVFMGASSTCNVVVMDTSPPTIITPSGNFSLLPSTPSCFPNPISPCNPGSFNSKCELSGTGGTATCTVSYTPTVADNHTITARYPGDSTHMPGSNAFNIVVIDFTIAANPTSVSVIAGSAGTSRITISSSKGFNGSIALTSDNSACTLTPPTVAAPSGTSTLSCTFASASSVTVTVKGVSGSLSRNASVTFTFADFNISATSPTGTVDFLTSDITLSSTGFGTVALTDVVPAGLTCQVIMPSNITFLPPPLGYPPRPATLSCSSTTAATFTVTITGTSGTVAHTATAIFTFTDFRITATSPAPVNTGSSATSTITVTALNGFKGTVALNPPFVSISGITSDCYTTTPGNVTLPPSPATATLSCTSFYTLNVTITGSEGSLGGLLVIHSVTVTFTFSDFAISATSAAANVGTSATATINVTGLSGFAGTVTLTDTIPQGLACNALTSGSVTLPPTTSTATLSCTSNSTGSFLFFTPFSVTITGTSGSLSHSATATFIFNDFTIATCLQPSPFSTTPCSSSAVAGSSAMSNVTISAVNGFAGTVAVTLTIPQGLDCGALAPGSITVPSPLQTASLSCSSTAAGTFTITVTGTSGSLSHSATWSLTFTDFSIAASSPDTVIVGSAAASTITLTSVNGFTGQVALTDSIPAGLDCSAITPASVTLSPPPSFSPFPPSPPTASLSCSSSTAGTFTLTITSTDGAISHSTTVTVRVTAPQPTPPEPVHLALFYAIAEAAAVAVIVALVIGGTVVVLTRRKNQHSLQSLPYKSLPSSHYPDWKSKPARLQRMR